MHRLSTSFVLGYHGCDRSVAADLISGVSFRASANDYDWLGWGVYFWEANPARALEFVHIQICVRTLASIKGVFLVTDPDAA